MRSLRLVAAGMAAVAAAALIYLRAGDLLKGAADRELSGYVQKASVSEAYILDGAAWTLFRIPPETAVLRIVTNANVPRTNRLAREQFLETVLAYQVLDRQGRVLLERDYTQRSGQSEFTDKQSGRKVPAYFYLEEKLQPLDGKIMLLNLKSVPGAAAVRFRAAGRDPLVADVCMRVYAAEKNAEERLKRLWLRLTDFQKERLTSGNVYPVDLVAEEEKLNILRNMLQPVGPAGIMGRDYRVRKLYVLKETFEREYDMPVMPAGLFIEKGSRGVVPVPAGGGRIRLSFSGTGFDAPERGGRIGLRWFGRNAFKRSERGAAWPGRAFDLEETFEEGVIEISPSLDVVVRAFHLEGGAAVEITPETLYQRTAVARQGQPVAFEVNHESGRPTPFRVDLRTLMGPSQKDRPRSARYRVLDAQGRTMGAGALPLVGEVSPYDRYAGDLQDVRVSEPATYYFRLPGPAHKLVIEAEEGQVLAAAYNRPPGLVRELSVPDDYLMTYRNLDRHPSWFFLKPLDYVKLFEEKRTVLLTIQLRPPEDIPDLMAGRYEWEDFHPEGRWLGRDLLTPWDNAGVYRPESLSALYQRVPAGTAAPVALGGAAGLKTVAPKLIFFRGEDRAVPYEVIVDGVPVFRGRMTGRSGSAHLPPIPTGRHDMRVAAGGSAEFYVSHVLPSADSKIIRLGNLMRGELDFIYEKATREDEVLSARLHVPAARKTPTVLRVTVEGVGDTGMGPWSGLTFPERVYHVAPGPGEPVPVLNTPGERVDQGQVFFIPFGSDLRTGRYRVRFRLEQGEGGYLVFYKLTPGVAPKRQILIENEGKRIQAYE